MRIRGQADGVIADAVERKQIVHVFLSCLYVAEHGRSTGFAGLFVWLHQAWRRRTVRKRALLQADPRDNRRH